MKCKEKFLENKAIFYVLHNEKKEENIRTEKKLK